jgi:O-antigen/teichoic acid export membrane protein
MGDDAFHRAMPCARVARRPRRRAVEQAAPPRMTPPQATLPPPATAAGETDTEGAGAGRSRATDKHLRGSTLLLAGRLISVAANFATQVLIVRHLSKADFGVFAYALSIVAMGQSIAALGIDRSVSRFIPIYDERRQDAKLAGSLLVAAATIVVLGLGIVVVVAGLRDVLAASGPAETSATGATVLLIMILLAPLQALDNVLIATFAAFSKSRSIFVRKHLLTPGLRLAAVVAVIALAGDAQALAVGYVIGGGIGVLLSLALLASILRSTGVVQRVRGTGVSLPARELFAFALPLLAMDLLFVLMNTSNVIMLGHFGTAEDVADYRVVQPAAHLNLLIMSTFALLFTPAAARLFAREDREGMSDLYWRTSLWVAVASFPVLAVTTAFAEPLTVTIFGERYSGSATILALLSVGYYVSAALGFNGVTLRVHGLVRSVVVVSLAAAAINLALNLALIPAFGAIGAGVGTCATFLVHNVLKQAALTRGTGIPFFERRHLRAYATIVATAGALVALSLATTPPLAVCALLVAAASALVLLTSRASMQIGATFPELQRLPLLRRLV